MGEKSGAEEQGQNSIHLKNVMKVIMKNIMKNLLKSYNNKNQENMSPFLIKLGFFCDVLKFIESHPRARRATISMEKSGAEELKVGKGDAART